MFKKHARQAERVPFTATKAWTLKWFQDNLKNIFKDVMPIGFFLYEKFFGVEFLNPRASYRHTYDSCYMLLYCFTKELCENVAYKK